MGGATESASQVGSQARSPNLDHLQEVHFRGGFGQGMALAMPKKRRS